MRVFFYRGFLVVIIAALSISLYNMLIIRNTYVHEERVHTAVSTYAPPFKKTVNQTGANIANTGDTGKPIENNEISAEAEIDAEAEVNTEAEVSAEANYSIADARQNINKDIAAWLRVPNTYIDYPVVRSDDNSFYLNHDVYKERAASGALFIDKRNNDGFMDFNTIIYGHNMKNGSMFGQLNNFGNQIFFSTNPVGQLFLSDRPYTIEIFAYLKIMQDDKYIYGSLSGGNFDEFNEYVRAAAVNYRDIQLSGSDHIVTLSTCSNDDANIRMVVLARLDRAG